MELNKIYNEDCIEGMKRLTDGSVDCVICDLPYGTTACPWDSIIPLKELWSQYRRIAKPNAPIILFGSEPFSTMLRMSNLREWRYDWIWEKNSSAGFVHAKNRPLKNYEIISAFCKCGMGHKSTMGDKRMTYNPQGLIPVHITNKNCRNKFVNIIAKRASNKEVTIQEWTNYPKAILKFDKDKSKYNTKQKPVALIQYLIRTYSNEGDTILDNCMGSGTTAIACIREKRNFIGFEKSEEYWRKSMERIRNELSQQTLF